MMNLIAHTRTAVTVSLAALLAACQAPTAVPTVAPAPTAAPTPAPAQPPTAAPTSLPAPTATRIAPTVTLVPTAVPSTATPKPVGKPDLSSIKAYLLATTAKLKQSSTALSAQSNRYYDALKAVRFDYAAAWKQDAATLKATLQLAREAWISASPLYEQVEGIVAGVPSLADFDVLLDAGGSAAEGGESVAIYDLKLPDGRVLRRPGNLFGVTESTLWGTFPAFVNKTPADWNGNGKLEFGEVLPDANVLKAGADELDRQVGLLEAAAKAWTPSESDAFTALVVMVPTMDEYFAAWKDSRFVAGETSTSRDFVAISRLADIGDILGSLQVVHRGVSPLIRTVDSAQDDQIERQLGELRKFVGDLHAQEQKGKVFSPEQADTLGAEAQKRATVITGLVSQAAARLKIKIAE
jgi:hypothetical protein